MIWQHEMDFSNRGSNIACSLLQLLVYLSLLETNKPYVMNCLRMPALQTLLLFSREVDASATFGRVVFDSWLELRFVDPEQAQNMVLAADRLRGYWRKLLDAR